MRHKRILGSMGTERRLTWFPGTSALEGGGSRNNGCLGVILEKNVEGVPGRGNGSMKKHSECEKAEQFIITKT